MAEGYCVKCRAKREMADAQEVTMKNGRPAMKGKCSVCGTGMYKILPKKEVLQRNYSSWLEFRTLAVSSSKRSVRLLCNRRTRQIC